LGFAEVLAEGLAEEVGVVAFAELGDVDVGKGTEEVRVTPAAAHTCWAIDIADARSEPEQLESKH